MPLTTPSSAFLTEKDQALVSDINLWQIRFTVSDILYFAERDHDVVFGGIIYQASSIRRTEIETKKDSTLSNCRVVIPDVNGQTWAHCLEHREVLKDMKIHCLVVFEGCLNDPNAFVEDAFEVTDVTRGNLSVEFHLKNPLAFDDWLPRFFYSKTKCRRTYGDIYCGHSGASCDNSRESCKALGNLENFGAFPLMQRRWS